MPNRYERECGYDIMRLSESARAYALEKLSDWNTDHNWWEFVYEDAISMGALLGICVEEINFTGFWSQGDGASFTGAYECKPDAVAAISAECIDKELLRIATELTQLQVAWKLEHGFTWECTIHRTDSRHSHSHSNTMQTGWADDEDGYDRVGFAICSEMDGKVQALMRRFADWIYKQLEGEHEHLTSAETLIESFQANDLRFSSSGERI